MPRAAGAVHDGIRRILGERAVDLGRIDDAAVLNHSGLDFGGGQRAAVLLPERIGRELAGYIDRTAVLDELLAGVRFNAEVACDGKRLAAVDGDVHARRALDRAAVDREVVAERNRLRAFNRQLFKVGESRVLRRRERMVATGEVKADFLDRARSLIIDIALDEACAGLVARIVENDLGRALDAGALSDFKTRARGIVRLLERDGVARNRGGGSRGGIVALLKIRTHLDGALRIHSDIAASRHIAGHIHAGLLAIVVATAYRRAGGLLERDVPRGGDARPVLDRDVLFALDCDGATGRDRSCLHLGGFLASEGDVARSGYVVIDLHRLAGASSRKRNVAASRFKSLVCVHVASNVDTDRFGGNTIIVLEIFLRTNLHVATSGYRGIRFDIAAGVHRQVFSNSESVLYNNVFRRTSVERFGEIAHQVDLALGRSGENRNRSAGNIVYLKRVARRRSDIAIEHRRVRATGRIFAEENVRASKLDLARRDRRALFNGDIAGACREVRSSRHRGRIAQPRRQRTRVDTHRKCAEDAADRDRAMVSDKYAARIEDHDVGRVASVSNDAIYRCRHFAGIDDVVPSAAVKSQRLAIFHIERRPIDDTDAGANAP